MCDPPHRIVLRTSSVDEPDTVVEVTLRVEGDRTVLVIEDRGVPRDHLADYGAGDQVHLEDLTAHLTGHGRCDARARGAQLRPYYAVQAAAPGLAPETSAPLS